MPIDSPWREALALAWESYRAGTIPVGAVVVDGAGAVVARGRNRIFDAHEAREGCIVGTRLAHAEVLALARLPSRAGYLDHVLYSTLEPCAYCAAAALHSTVGAVRFLAADPFGGGYTAAAPPAFPHRRPDVVGPAGGEAARVSTALNAAFWLRSPRETAQAILAAFEGLEPGCAEAGRRLLAADLPEGFEEALPRLLELTS